MKILASGFMVLFLSSLLISCHKQVVTSPAQQEDTVNFLAKMSISNAPSEVASITGILEREGYSSVTAAFDMQADTATADFGSIYSGLWHLSVTAYSDSNEAIYKGETDVYIYPGKENIIYLQLNPLTGKLTVIVTWGGQSSEGSALDFNGDNSLLYVPKPGPELDSLSRGVTFEAWIKPRSSYIYPRIIDRSDNDLNDRYVFGLNERSGGVHLNVNGASAKTPSFPFNTWTHVAGTFDGQSIKLYVNGQLKANTYYWGYIDVKNSSLFIGNNNENDRQFDGAIDEVRIWNYARSAAEIQSTMNKKLSGNEQGLVAYWPINEGQGQFVEDIANGNNAILGKTPDAWYDDPLWINHPFGN